MKQRLLIFFISLFIVDIVQAQLSITNGKNTIDIGGSISTLYNHRFLREGFSFSDDYKKNRFSLRDLQFEIEGRVAHEYEYKLQVDFADVASGANDPENPGLMDAWIEYKKLPIDIKIGYQKLPYSRTSMSSIYRSAYWQRSEMARGEFFSRRDIGVTLSKTLWAQRINLYAGAYTGMGEQSLFDNNDRSGNPEVVGRADFSYPARYRYRDIDEEIVPIPMFSLGVNARYTKKGQTTGEEYQLKTINGEKRMFGADFAFKYQGFSIIGEIHEAMIIPNKNSGDMKRLYDFKTDRFYAYGSYVSANYHIKPLKSVFSVRYDNFNQNYLSNGIGTIRSIGGGYVYQINGLKSCIKVQYLHTLKPYASLTEDFKFVSQVRGGWQFTF
jgi:hypothetical protein